jgi:hypothetical protein
MAVEPCSWHHGELSLEAKVCCFRVREFLISTFKNFMVLFISLISFLASGF